MDADPQLPPVSPSTASRRLRRVGWIAVFLSVIAALLHGALPFAVQLPPALMRAPDASPVIEDRHGVPIVRLTLPDASRCAPLTADALPNDFLLCTLAAEDKRFFDHSGIDWLATTRSARDALMHRRFTSGASTITQQLIKISSPPARRSLTRKLHETLAARRLEMTWSKSSILLAYLNRLDYGNLRTGPIEAARFYFQKPLADLSLAECALLAGLPQAPTRLNPLQRPKSALARRDRVLHRLARNQSLPPERIAAALAEPLQLRPLTLPPDPAPWLTAQHPGISNSTHPLRTTLDLPLQIDVETIVREETFKLRNSNLRHAAVVILHNPTREILCLVSSANWRDPRGGEFNGTLLPRSPGSALKPWVYLLAMEQNHRTPASILEDIPSSYRTPEGLSLPENYDRRFRGPVSLREALACSLNLPAMRELNALGGPAPLHQLLASLGIHTLGTEPSAHGLGLAIGNAPVRLLDLTNAYATLATLGFYRPPQLFLTGGQTFYLSTSLTPPTASSHLPFSEISYLLLADILADPAARAPVFPPGGPLDLPFRCAVKTGTSSDFRDNWCLGYTPEFTVGVWAGNFENQPMKGVSGVAGAGPIFHRAMLRLHRDKPATWFPASPQVTEITVDARNGKSLASAVPAPHARRERVPADRIPPPATSADYTPDGRAILPEMFAAWYASPHNQRSGELAPPRPSDVIAATPLRILRPAAGAVFLLDPEVPSGTDRLIPLANPPGTAQWSCKTLEIVPNSPEPTILLRPGSHLVLATDPRTHRVHQIPIQVKSIGQ